MLISLIIPVYNAEKYISDAIESVLQQPLKDIEIILVDDGSTDNSQEICRKYEKEYSNVRYIKQENKGASVARNVGMNLAEGKYVMFLDADDRLVPDSLNTQMEQILKEDADIIACSNYFSNFERNRYSVESQLMDRCVSGWQIFNLPGHFGACIYRLRMLKERGVSFDAGVALGEDQVFKMKALYVAEKVRMVSQFLYIYCNTPTSITHTYEDKYTVVDAWLKAREWFLENCRKEHLPQIMQYLELKITSKVLFYAKYFAQIGNGENALLEELKRVNGYDRLMKVTSQWVMPYQRNDLYLLQNDVEKFIKEARKEGLKLTLGRLVLKVKIVRKIRDKKRYPITEI